MFAKMNLKIHQNLYFIILSSFLVLVLVYYRPAQTEKRVFNSRNVCGAFKACFKSDIQIYKTKNL